MNDFIGSIVVTIIFGIIARVQKNRQKQQEQKIESVDDKVYRVAGKVEETKKEISNIDQKITVVVGQVKDHTPDIDWLKKEDSYIREEIVQLRKAIYQALEKRSDLLIQIADLHRYKEIHKQSALQLIKMYKTLNDRVEKLSNKGNS